VFLDWIAGTVPGINSEVTDSLRSYFGNWQVLDRGGLGYDCCAKVFDSGRVFWHSTRRDMGVHVRLPASALAAMVNDPVTVLCDLARMSAKFTRIDVAADDYWGLLDLERIRAKILLGELTCRSHAIVEWVALRGIGHTFYFGARASETFMRIYDKAAEQRSQGVDVTFCDTWTRVEAELKHERADLAARFICAHPDTWAIEAAGWFLNFLCFKDPVIGDINPSRWPTSLWWSVFLDRATKARLIREKVTRTVEDVKRWVERQVAPSLFVLAATIGHDELFEIVGEGSGRLRDDHTAMIDAYNKMLVEMDLGGVEHVEAH
jgi:phage replication initiation protein